MDILMVILRLIHIFSAVIWAGLAFTMVLFITPVVQTMGAEGGKFMQRISSGKNFRSIVPSVAGLTVLSGLIMYYRLFGFLAPLNTGPGLALTVGGLAGILAMVDGIRLGRKQESMQALGEEIDASGKLPTPEQAASLATLQEQVAASGAISAILMVVALAGMTLSEYLAF